MTWGIIDQRKTRRVLHLWKRLPNGRAQSLCGISRFGVPKRLERTEA